MRQTGDRRPRGRRAPRYVAEYVGAATWQQRATLSLAVVGGVACAYLVVHLLGLEIRVPGLAAPARTPAFVPGPAVSRPQIALRSPAERPATRPVAKQAPRRPLHVTRSRPSAARPAAGEASVPTAPTSAPEAPAPTPPPAQPRPAPPDTGASVEPPVAAAAIVPAATALPTVSPPALPALPELPVPSVEPVPTLPVPLPTIP
jgi:hypothetical protein